jgi:hypothetical protein
MTLRQPGTRLYQVLERCVDHETFARVVEPTIADLQHEAASARSGALRAAAVFNGYVAVLRALVFSAAIAPRSPLMAGVTLSLGIGSAFLWNRIRVVSADPRIAESALLLPAFIVPALACLLEGRRSYVRLFVLSAASGAASSITLDVLVSFLSPSSVVWHVVRLANGAGSTALASALAAAIVWNPLDVRGPILRRTMTGLAYAGFLMTAAFAIRTYGVSAEGIRYVALRAPFFVMLFAIMLGVTVLPFVLVARRWLTHRAWFTLFAAACFPAPILGAAFVDGGTSRTAIADCLQCSWPALIASLPFIVGATTLGLFIGTRTAVKERTTP